MNTLEQAFKGWFEAQRLHEFDDFNLTDLRAAFDAGYVGGFDHAKKEAIRVMSGALPKPLTPYD